MFGVCACVCTCGLEGSCRLLADWTEQESVKDRTDFCDWELLGPEGHRGDDIWYLERARWQAYRPSLRWVVLGVRFSGGL